MPQNIQMLRDFAALPPEERRKVISASSAPPILRDFEQLPESEKQKVIGGGPTENLDAIRQRQAQQFPTDAERRQADTRTGLDVFDTGIRNVAR